MKNDIKVLKNYFDSRAKISASGSFINGYSGDIDSDNEKYYSLVFDEIHSVLHFNSDDFVLDIGCGSGEILKRINTKSNKCQGIDISIEMINLVHKQGLNACLYDGKKLPFDDGTFNKVVIQNVIINLDDINYTKQFIIEAYRVLKSDGVLLIGGVVHPRKSIFIQHNNKINVIKNIIKKILLIKSSRNISYYSYDYRFFLDIFDQVNGKAITIQPHRIPIRGWKQKYMVVLVKQ